MERHSVWHRARRHHSLGLLSLLIALPAAATSPAASTPTTAETFESIAARLHAVPVANTRRLADSLIKDCRSEEGQAARECKRAILENNGALAGKSLIFRGHPAGPGEFDGARLWLPYWFQYLLAGDLQAVRDGDANGTYLLTLGGLKTPFFMSGQTFLKDRDAVIAHRGGCARKFATRREADAWQIAHPNPVAVEIVAKVREAYSVGGGQLRGHAMEPMAVRVYDTMTGEIVCANPGTLARYVFESWGNLGGPASMPRHAPPRDGPAGLVRTSEAPASGAYGLLIDGRLVMAQPRPSSGALDGPKLVHVSVSPGEHEFELVIPDSGTGDLRKVVQVHAFVEVGKTLELDTQRLGAFALGTYKRWASGELADAYLEAGRYQDGYDKLGRAQQLAALAKKDEARALMRGVLGDFPHTDERIHQLALQYFKEFGGGASDLP